jgi:NAD(P)H-flavin reductase/cytochrome b involved in lipid metabolism
MSSSSRRLSTLTNHLIIPGNNNNNQLVTSLQLSNTAAPVPTTPISNNNTHNNKINPSTFTKSQILAKRKQGRCMIVLHGNVYDVTDFLDEHPGGTELITDIAPDDFDTMTQEFEDADHSEEAMDQLKEFFKGKYVMDDDNSTALSLSSSSSPPTADNEEEMDDSENIDTHIPLGDPNQPFQGRTELSLALMEKQSLSHDVTVYRFSLTKPNHIFSLDIGKHILLSFEEDGKIISRAYTPVSPYGDTGFIDFLIKAYPNGKMSEHLRRIQIGDTIKMKGPKGKLGYLGNGKFSIRRKGMDEIIQLKRVGMVAGGSGITPMFQIIQAVATNPQDNLEISLLFANKTEADIILRHPLAVFAKMKPKNIKIRFVLDNPPQKWDGEAGFVSEEMLRKYMPPPSKDSMIFLCGPPPMIKKALNPALKMLGYENEWVFRF